MNKLAAFVLLALVLATGLIQARPEPRPSASDPKIGVVDIERVVTTSAAGIRATEAFDTSRKSKQGALDKQQEELKRANTELEAQKSVLDSQEFEKRRQALEKSFVALQQTYVKLERELAQDRTKLIQDVLKQAEPEIQRIAKEGGYTLILDKNSTLWLEPGIDLTELVKTALK